VGELVGADVIPLSFGSTADVLQASWAAVGAPGEIGRAAWRRYVAEWLCHELRIDSDRVVLELLDEVLAYAQRTPGGNSGGCAQERGSYRPRGYGERGSA
jgi:hypothetical protein